MFVLLIVVSGLFSCSDSESEEKENKIAMESEILKACNRLNVCELSYFDVNDCLHDYNYWLNLNEGTEQFNQIKITDVKEHIMCLNDATTCEEAITCEKTYKGTETTTEECGFTGFQESCNGTVMSKCSYIKGGISYVLKTDCAVFGQECIYEADYNNARCGKIVDCTENSSECEGSVRKVCDGGIYFENDCSMYANGECVVLNTDTEKGAYCLPKEPSKSCSKMRCDSSKIIYCSEGKELVYDCKTNYGENFTCLESNEDDDSKSYSCMFKDSIICYEEATCDGDILKYCLNGETKEYNCKENGYSSCKSASQPDFTKAMCIY